MIHLYINDPKVRLALRDAVCERQEEDFNDNPDVTAKAPTLFGYATAPGAQSEE